MPNSLALSWQKLSGSIDRVNDRFTSYRLMLYFLLALVVWAVIGSFFNFVPYNWHEILAAAVWLLVVCWVVNELLARLLNIPANKESNLITALILTLILQPPLDAHGVAVLGAAGAVAMASKYVIVWRKSHVFNPAAAGAFIAGWAFHYDPAWWVGTKFMTPIVVIGGILILRKMKRFTMVGLFLLIYILYLIFGSGIGTDGHFLWLAIISTQVLFFAVVMLTEPATSPTSARQYLTYAGLVGILYSVVKLHISPEAALLIGNMFTFAAQPNRRYELSFVKRAPEADGIYSYLFAKPPGLNFAAGQYMEWTIAQHKSDSRGNRRYFTISSAPEEDFMMFTLKQPPKASAFKQSLAHLKPGDKILAAHLAGSFTLPPDPAQKLAFLAGGVGITPFRSMVKNIADSNQPRDAALIYSATTQAEIAFKDLFKQAGIKTHYIVGQPLDSRGIKELLPDYKHRLFYVSGPYGFVQAMEQALLKLDVARSKIIVDFFPGYDS